MTTPDRTTARAALVAAVDALEAHARAHCGPTSTAADCAVYTALLATHDAAQRAYRVARGLDADTGVPL